MSKAMGYVNDSVRRTALAKLPGTLAIGHVRYSTAGESRLANAQPIVVDSAHGQLAVCHNGNLVNAGELRDELVRRRRHLPDQQRHRSDRPPVRAGEGGRRRKRHRRSIAQVRGAFSLVMMTKDRLIGARDPHGFRPLALGRLGDAWVLCSETCAMDLIGATYLRDVEPGEVVVIELGRHAIRSSHSPRAAVAVRLRARVFRAPGQLCLRRERQRGPHGVRSPPGAGIRGADADVVVPIPDSGVCAAVGYAEASGMPMRMGLIRNHYVGRTFIQPQQSIRHFGVRVKLNPVRSILEGKRVVLVDDSIVRGTTSRKIVRMVRSAGAQEVHMRISCPPTVSPCFYGVDTPRRSELIAATHTLEEIRRYLDADSVAYLSLEGLTAP